MPPTSTTRIIGPFAVAWNDAGIANGAPIGPTLAAGSIVAGAWVAPTQSFNGDDPTLNTWYVVAGDPNVDGLQVAGGRGLEFDTGGAHSVLSDLTQGPYLAVLPDARQLYVVVQEQPNVSQGSFNVYALIQAPSR